MKQLSIIIIAIIFILTGCKKEEQIENYIYNQKTLAFSSSLLEISDFEWIRSYTYDCLLKFINFNNSTDEETTKKEIKEYFQNVFASDEYEKKIDLLITDPIFCKIRK